MTEAAVVPALALGVLFAVGWGALRPRTWPGKEAGREILATLPVVGASLAVPTLLAALLLGIPLRPLTVLGVCGGLSAALWSRPRHHRPPLAPPPKPRWQTALSAAVLVLALAVVAWKVALTPVWSWDHFAIWGTRARRLFPDGYLDLGALARASPANAHPRYPLGVPLIWRLAALGGVPGVLQFKLFHLLFGATVVLVVRRGALDLGRSPVTANALAAWLAASAVLWDTVGLGLADVFLGAWAATSVVLTLRVADGEVAPWLSGAVLGFLAWIKLEGLPLALLLLTALAIVCAKHGQDRASRRGLWISGSAALSVAGAAVLFRFLFLPAGGGRLSSEFFAGEVWSRGLKRLAGGQDLLALAVRLLLDPAWLGLWPVVLATLLLAILLRRPTAAGLSLVVVAQLAGYALAYLVTRQNPSDLVAASLPRIAGALLPVGLLAVAALGPRVEGTSPRADLTARRGLE